MSFRVLSLHTNVEGKGLTTAVGDGKAVCALGIYPQVGRESVVVDADNGRNITHTAHRNVNVGVVAGIVGNYHVTVVSDSFGRCKREVVGFAGACVNAESQAVAAFFSCRMDFGKTT